MRITFNMQAMKYHESLSSGLSSMASAADKVNNKRNLLSPEQNASNYVSAYNIQRMIDELTQFGENGANASTWLKNGDNELQQAIKLLTTAKDDLAIGGANSTNSAESRKALAGDVLNIFNSLMDIANANYMGRYLFGGFETARPPFSSGTNQVSSVISATQNGGDVSAKPVYGDLPELGDGKYKVEVSVDESGVGTLKVFDDKGNPMILDSNGSDESGAKGNNSSTSMTFEYKPGAVINTGRGISIKLPQTNETSITLNMNYKSGSQMNYNGDTGSIFSKIGYNQDVAINVPGSSIFTQSYKTLMGTRFNTINGMPANATTYFNQLDKANSGIGDSIKLSGTDHNGNKVGSAQVISPINPKLDLSKASEKERTLTVSYGDKLYEVVVPQGAYKDSAALSDAINNQLKNAQYVGSITPPVGGFQNMQHYNTTVQSQLETGEYRGSNSPKNFVDLSGEIKVSADGGRLQFNTTKAGDNVRLTVSGQEQNALGFNNRTLGAEGKDTVFEIGYDFNKKEIEGITTTHSGKDLSGGTFSVFINGKMVNVAKPPITQTTNTLTGQNLNDPAGYTIKVKGKDITIDPAVMAGATTDADRSAVINDAIRAAGMASEANVNVTTNGATFDVDLTTTDQSKKEMEFAFDQAIRNAGLGHGVTVRLDDSTPSALGVYDVSFTEVNSNIGRDTQMTTTWYDQSTNPATAEMQTMAPERDTINTAKEKTLGDYAKFVENLYGDSVDVTFENGKLQVKDLRSGESKLSMNALPSNQGVGHPTDQATIVGGKYTGTKSDEWRITVTTEMLPSGQRDILVAINDSKGNKLFDVKSENYVGGEISLPYGVKLNPNDMGLPDPLDPTATTRSSTFNVKLTASPSLGFGDMNVIESGKNVNIFQSLKNLENALNYNITKNGFSEPTAWKDPNFKSSAKPFLDGTFQGSFNDDWKYEALPTNGKNDFYLQNEYKANSGTIRFDPALTANLGSEIAFGVDLYDNVSGKMNRVDVNIDLSKAVPPITNPEEAQKYILSTLNNDSRFSKEGVNFVASGGKIEMESGSGTKIATFANSGDSTTRGLTSFVMGFDSIANDKLEFPITTNGVDTFQVADIYGDPLLNPTFPSASITIPAGTYANKEDLLAAVNTELASAEPAGTNGRITASYDSTGALQFKRADGSIAESSIIEGTPNPLGIAQSANALGDMNMDTFAVAAQKPKTDLSEASEEERTLKFSYMAGVPPRKEERVIILEKKAYGSPAELADDVNAQLARNGIPAAQMKAVVTTDGKLAFSRSDQTLQGITVEGDYAGSLGFPKAGDEAKIKVTSSDGTLVQETTLNTANKTTYISDGVYLGFDKGKLNATDSFNAAVGSGIEREIGVLDAAQKQVLEALAIIGNRGSRVDTVVKFQATVIASNEKAKAGYLGSTEIDQIKAMTELELAKSAYETALSVTGKIMSISLLDFLR